MALIHINADGSFEALATARSYATEIATTKEVLASLKRILADAKKKVAPMRKAAELKKQIAKTKDPKVAERLKRQLAVVLTKAMLSSRSTVAGVESKVRKIEARIEIYTRRLDKLVEKNKAKPAAKKAVTRKVSFDNEARRAVRETTQGIKGKLRELDAKSKEPTKKKPAKSTVKHVGSVKTGAKATVLASIKQIKADIAKGLTGPKLARAQAELKKQRAALRELRKGESAANKAAVQPRQKASKAGMGSSKTRAGTGGRTPAQQNKKTTLARKKAIGK